MSKTTISDDGPWEYIGLLNECLRILLTIGLGFVFGHFRVFQAKTFVPQTVKFVFYIALPTLVLRGLGIGIDLYNVSWTFICVFLVLRAIALLLAFLWVYIRGDGIGQVAVIWLSLTWISTVILGIPISTAVFGNPKLGQTYGILAGISSFIFQLPFQLLFLECHAVEEERRAIQENPAVDDMKDVEDPIDEDPQTILSTDDAANGSRIHPLEECAGQEQKDANSGSRLFEWVHYAGTRDVWVNLGIKLLKNPVLWGIAGGFVLSLSTIGPKYLNPTSKDYVPGLGWIFTTLKWLGDCVSPVSLFTMGVWMQGQGMQLFQLRPIVALLFMLSKLVLVPLIVLGLAVAVNLDDQAGRAAVLIAALPISMASFSLGAKYNIGQAILSTNVALGTLLLLPTILIWNLVLDALNLFPLPN